MSQTPLRVLMLIHRLIDNSPYSFYVHEQAKALQTLGHQVVVISPVPVLPLQKHFRPAAYAVTSKTPRQGVVDGIPVYYPRFPALGNGGERLLGGWHEAQAALPTARRLHREKPFDVIHAHILTMDGHAGLIIGKKLGVPVVLTAHGTDVFRYYTHGPSPRNRRIAQTADAVCAVSGKLADILQPYCNRPVEIVFNGVDLTLIPPQPHNEPQQLLSGGTLKARKCMLTTLEAFIALAQDYPQATLTIFGEGEQRPQLEALIAAHHLGDRVRLTGNIPHPQALALMAQSDAFIMPSYGEGFGVVYIEAMAAGCLAVGSVNEGIADLVQDGVNGFLVPAGDTQALIPVMRRLLSGEPGLQAIRAQGQADARQLTWHRNALQMIPIYRRLGGSTSRR